MATPVINNLVLPNNRILVLPDGPAGSSTTGVIFRRSAQGGGHFKASADPEIASNHILYSRDMATMVEIDEVEYVAMQENAVVGLIPED